MNKRLIIIITVGALAGVLLLPLNPVNSKMLKIVFLGSTVGVWIGFTILFWKRRFLRYFAFTIPFLMIIPFILPGREIDSEELRTDYLKRMNDFEGTKYHWGGESSLGIDCSGLPRKALRDALFSYGIKHLNGLAFRSFIEQWWFDASAKALGEEYRNYTRPLGISGTIEKMDYSSLVPGDLAVTTCGVHVLVYFGNGQWIQAEPNIGAVVTLDGRTVENVWFSTPITMHRWTILSQE